MKRYKSLKEKSEFLYGLVFRPPSKGAIPEDFINYDDSKKAKEKYRHGMITYAKKLSDKQIDSFEMYPIGEDYLKRTVKEIKKKMGRYLDRYLEKENEQILIDRISDYLTSFPFHLKTHVDNIPKIVKEMHK